jgi:hypothetical protein
MPAMRTPHVNYSTGRQATDDWASGLPPDVYGIAPDPGHANGEAPCSTGPAREHQPRSAMAVDTSHAIDRATENRGPGGRGARASQSAPLPHEHWLGADVNGSRLRRSSRRSN